MDIEFANELLNDLKILLTEIRTNNNDYEFFKKAFKFFDYALFLYRQEVINPILWPDTVNLEMSRLKQQLEQESKINQERPIDKVLSHKRLKQLFESRVPEAFIEGVEKFIADEKGTR